MDTSSMNQNMDLDATLVEGLSSRMKDIAFTFTPTALDAATMGS